MLHFPGFGGLSPLARGNRTLGAKLAPMEGPIPARAGEPSGLAVGPRFSGAYPRSRGGTLPYAVTGCVPTGLSPLARGNHGVPGMTAKPPGPIPARAGEPKARRDHVRHPGAYPRSRGGTGKASSGHVHPVGLSPLARGNLTRYQVAPGMQGPIPARAGEPQPQTRLQRPPRAYPRSRGGTARAVQPDGGAHGLSPLARGNLGVAFATAFALGPIPARAGEPEAQANRERQARAYPRSRGGTARNVSAKCAEWGLSPLARGNQ